MDYGTAKNVPENRVEDSSPNTFRPQNLSTFFQSKNARSLSTSYQHYPNYASKEPITVSGNTFRTEKALLSRFYVTI